MRAPALSFFDPLTFEINARIERWLLDEVPFPGRLVAEIIQFLYREDRFCRGALRIGSRTVGPSTVQVPVLAIVNSADAIAPLGSVKPFLDAAPAEEIRIIEFPGERGVSIQHLAFLAEPWVYAQFGLRSDPGSMREIKSAHMGAGPAALEPSACAVLLRDLTTPATGSIFEGLGRSEKISHV